MSISPELQFLPHGPEFRFIEEVTELDPGVSGSAHYTISGDEEFLKGHFPENPLWPGVIMVEAIAQLGGVVAQSDPEIPPLEGLLLTAIRNIKIKGTTSPGAILTIKAKVEGRMGNIVQISGSVSEGDKVLAQGGVVLSGQ